LKQYENNLRGFEFENLLFDALQSTLTKLEVKNTTIFSGFKIHEKHSLTKKNEEYDFFIIAAPQKMIIHIEAKCTNSEDGKNKEKAASQLRNGFAYFRSSHAFPITENWTIVKMIAFKNNCHEPVCPSCRLFVLDPNQNWISNLWWMSVVGGTKKWKTDANPMPDQRGTS
jgi:hypothetical protein